MGRKSKNKAKSSIESRFMRDLIQYAMDVYGLTYKPPESTGQNVYAEIKQESFSKGTSSPFCIHIGEAVVALSYVNRLNFKLRFDEKYDFIARNTFNLNKFVTDFCKEIYIEGYFDQFFIVYGFVIDLLIYMAFKKQVYYFKHMMELFNVIFPTVLKDKFLKRGGWVELKRKARPWSHTYRNLSKDLAFSLDFRSPSLILFNANYTKELLSRFPIAIKSYEEYEDKTYPDDLKEAYEGQFLELKSRMETLTPEQQACSINSCQMFCLTKAISKKEIQSFSKAQRGSKSLHVASTNATSTTASQDISGNTSQKSRRNRKNSPRKLSSPAFTSQTSPVLQTASICNSEPTAISLDILDTTLTDTSGTSSVSEDSTHTSQAETFQTFSGSADNYQTALADLSHKCWASEDIPENAATDISLPQNILQTETVDASQRFSVFSELSPVSLAATSPAFIVYNILQTTAADTSQKDLVPEGIPHTSSAETLHTFLAFESIPQTSLGDTSQNFVVSEDILETTSDDTSRAFLVPKDIPQTSSAATFQKFSPSVDISQPAFLDTSCRCVASENILEAASTDISLAFSVSQSILPTETSGTSQTFSVSSELPETASADTSQMFSVNKSPKTAPADASMKSPAAKNAPQTSSTDKSQKFAVSEGILKIESADNSPALSLPQDIFQTGTADDSLAVSFFAELPQTADPSQTFEISENVIETTSVGSSDPFSIPEYIPRDSNSETLDDQVATEIPQRNPTRLLKRLDVCEELVCSLLGEQTDLSSKAEKNPLGVEVTEKLESCDEITDTSPCDEMVQFFRNTLKEVKQELSKLGKP